MLFITSSGLATPRAEIPMPLLPVPYAAPMFAKMRANAAPMNPQKGASGAALANSSSDTGVWQAGADGEACAYRALDLNSELNESGLPTPWATPHRAGFRWKLARGSKSEIDAGSLN